MNFFTQNFSGRQIKALLRKDLIVRLRQPWMTILQIIWPIAIFLALYTFRYRFEEKIVPDCQFPTRLLPSNNQVLSFFHSYICTIENQCLKTDKYEDYTTFDEAPLKPVLNIVQTFLNDDKLYNAIYELPEKVNFVTAITTIATHPKFSYMENNIQNIIGRWPKIEKMVGPNFDIKKLFADSMTFSRSGNIICGRPFPRSDNIRFVENILDSEDFSSINDNELNDMPTKYCKRLYLDVTSTNRGKITWSALKPILQGKIIYGPNNNETMEIIKFTNTTYEDMGRLQNFAKALNTILIKLRNDEKFKSGFTKLLEFARSPFVQMTVGGSVDINMIESIMKRLLDDQVIFDIIETVYNILQCFSVDRFITAENEDNLQDIAHKLDEKNLFYAAVYFNQTSNKNIVYKIKVEPDNTPITLETKNRFWFPGPDASMELDLKYHRGFVQIKHSIDMGIIKYKKNLKNDEKKNLKNNVKENTGNENNWWFELEKDDDNNDYDDDFDSINSDNQTVSNKNGLNSNNESLSTTEEYETLTTPSPMIEDLYSKTISPSTMISSQTEINSNDSDELTTTAATTTTTLNPNEQLTLNRKKRAPQFDGILGLLFGNNDKKEDPEFKINVNDIRVYTKQFPYPSYVKDDFKNGLYLAQAIQMAFFVALLIQIATCIRYRIWMKESKNTMLMRSMGLKEFSEILAWILTTFIEITIVFFLACVILYSGGILKYTGFMFLFVFLTLFGLCTISFCFLCSTIFSSASVGSASSVILFLMTFMPYIIIICLDTKLSGFVMFIINLSFSTPFCYAWDYIMRQELQGIGTTFSEVFQNGFCGEFSYAFGMICLDLILYAVCAYLIERFGNGEFKFHSVSREDLDTNVGAIVQNASKIYENMKIAVSNITLEFHKNQITCLLGRNGAGKSTIIKMLTGQIKPSSGEVILSQALADQNQSDRIGLCSQDNVLIPNLTAREHLEMYAKIKLKHGIQLEVMKIMNNLKFGKYENYKVCKLSGGYQRRLCVAIAFLGSPNVVILDEPCSGVDTRARKFVWDLIEILKKGRAVVLATHYLDEAEYLSDSVIILAEGKIVAKHSPDTLKSLFTKTFEINITHKVPHENHIHDEIEINLNKYLQTYNILDNSDDYNLKLSIPYEWNDQEKQDRKHNPIELLQYLENLQTKNKIQSIAISSKNLEEIFNNLNEKHELNGNNCNTNSIVSKHDSIYKNNDQQSISIPVSSKSPVSLLSTSEKISRYEIIKILLWKRLLHFKRNYRLLLSILVLPVIFEIIAMGFMQLRPGGEYDRALNLSKYELYPNSTEFIGLENGTEFINMTYKLLNDECRNCRKFENSERIFNWILDTNNLYPTDRYGGLTFNDTYAIVWYYNKGYHSMMAWLNDLNTHLLQAELNDTEYSISTLNQPIKLSERELTYSSILQQVSDAGVSLIILISFSLVVAGASVYIVNERITGEKLQQKLCGVDCRIYWGVAFIWDFLVLLLAVLLCVIVFECFKIPAYVAKSNLNGICLLLVLYGFALIPAVHIAEKLFSDPSFANMMIFCLNVVIALTTLTIIVMIDILGESDQSMKWRNFLNRAFLIFPQHALSDGLIEICKNYIVAEIFSKFDIDPYKSPITSNLLLPHFVSLTVLGIIFIIINYVIENGIYKNLIKKICNKNDSNYELKILSIQNSLKCEDKYRYYSNSSINIKNEATLTDNYNGHCSIYDHNDYVLRVDNLYKSYNKNDFAVRNVSFHVKTGECFGLLGNNGAGKSTIFKILSGQLTPTSGHIHYRKNEIAYCPQTSALDPLLTVEECIKFYGRLRKINDIENLITTTLKSLHLDPYKNVLVKNLSGGNRRKLNVAVSCLGNVNLILMDEPTSDMDPVTRSLVYQKIVKLINENKSILLTSHTISELEKVCHRITIIKEGKLISTGTPEELIQIFGGYYIVTIFHDKTDTTQLKMNIREEFSNYEDMQLHAHSIKFVIQIMPKSNVKTNDETVTNSLLSLSELFKKLKLFCDQQSQGEEHQNIIKFTIVRCRLDKVFEKILDSSKFNDGANIQRSATRTETTAA